MVLAALVGGAVGYVLGARAGRERYDAIVGAARRIAGSQTVQSSAGILQARIDALAHQAVDTVTGHQNGSDDPPRHRQSG